MLQFLLDTDHLTLYDYGHLLVAPRIAAQPLAAVGVGAVSIEEYLRGRLARLARAKDGATRIQRYGFLLQTLDLLCGLSRVPFDQTSENHFQQLLALKLRIGTQDLKIAAIALANNVTLLTRNRRDFSRIPSLAFDDWSV